MQRRMLTAQSWNMLKQVIQRSSALSDEETIGKSREGNSTKIHLAVDSGGLPVHFELSRGSG
ncbi:MAG: hypothetical protein CENE_01185 [Candidatus Celerinatantimonas neptuna]|nr:MAG: hypothetical protein CENE_01185 [Candidatus Celerinatantimonas neptuna]